MYIFWHRSYDLHSHQCVPALPCHSSCFSPLPVPPLFTLSIHPLIHLSFYSSILGLTAECLVPPLGDVDSTVLALIDVGFNGLTQDERGPVQRTQVKDTTPEVLLMNKLIYIKKKK